MSQSCPTPYKSSSEKKLELNLSNYATKADLKRVTGADTLSLAAKSNQI